jgi:hypothetical protein
MNEKVCWSCGHPYEHHTIEGGCNYEGANEHCDCVRYEDAEYLGEQRKRDIYTVSDRRRLNMRRNRRA